MHHNKWFPCLCTAVLGILVIILAWWNPSWSRIAFTVLGILIIIKGLVNKCCCEDMVKKTDKGSGCCCG